MAAYWSGGLIVLQQGSGQAAFETAFGALTPLIVFGILCAYTVGVMGALYAVFGVVNSRFSTDTGTQNKASYHAVTFIICLGAVMLLAAGPQIMVELGVPGAESLNGINVFSGGGGGGA